MRLAGRRKCASRRPLEQRLPRWALQQAGPPRAEQDVGSGGTGSPRSHRRATRCCATRQPRGQIFGDSVWSTPMASLFFGADLEGQPLLSFLLRCWYCLLSLSVNVRLEPFFWSLFIWEADFVGKPVNVFAFLFVGSCMRPVWAGHLLTEVAGHVSVLGAVGFFLVPACGRSSRQSQAKARGDLARLSSEAWLGGSRNRQRVSERMNARPSTEKARQTYHQSVTTKKKK